VQHVDAHLVALERLEGLEDRALGRPEADEGEVRVLGPVESRTWNLLRDAVKLAHALEHHLVAVVGEEALSARDKLYLTFAENFERRFISQGVYENRDIDATLDLGWELLSALPETELKRIDPETIKKWHPKYRDKPMTPVVAS